MIYLAFGALAFVSLLAVVMVILQGRLMLAMLKKQGLVDANEALVPRFRGRKDGIQPMSALPPEMDLTNAPNLPIGLDGSS